MIYFKHRKDYWWFICEKLMHFEGLENLIIVIALIFLHIYFVLFLYTYWVPISVVSFSLNQGCFRTK